MYDTDEKKDAPDLEYDESVIGEEYIENDELPQEDESLDISEEQEEAEEYDSEPGDEAPEDTAFENVEESNPENMVIGDTACEDEAGVQRKHKKEKKHGKSGKERKKFRMWSFSRRLLAMCILPMVATCVLITAISSRSLRASIEGEVENAMRIAAVAITETYTNLYSGDYTKGKDGSVRKGDVMISGKTDLVDAMSEKTGYNVTMLFGNMRLLTTVKKSSGAGRANGTSVDEALYAEIEKGEPVFLTDTVIVATESYAYYEPLINSDGSVFGAVEIAMDKKSVEDMVKTETRKLAIFSIVIVVLVCVLVVLLSRGMVGKMTRIKSFLDRIIAGKLDAAPDQKGLKSNDELGDVYRSSVKLQGTVQDMVGGMLDSSTNLKVSAGDLSNMAQNTTYAAEGVQQAVERISEGARSQANSTNEARNSVMMINDQIEQIIGEVDFMAKNAEEMSRKEQESEEIINELSDSCDDTKLSVARATEQIELMSSAINEIKDTITLIQSIADETDLLALNANIEAAKAGEAGRGFSVVADQISKLAVQSNESSEDIQQIINKILEITERAVEVMGEVHANMGIQQQKLSLTRETYQQVANGVDQSLNNMENIKKKINILNESGISISNAIEELSLVSEENANSAADTIQTVKDMNLTMQQVQESSEELLSMAYALQEMMGEFEI